jgi:TPR repeat protein
VDNSHYDDSVEDSVSCDLKTTQASADRGDAEAQFRLGIHYASLKEHDYPRASHWMLLAAMQNHALAQFNFGVMCAEGQGSPKDEAKALVWFQKAADLGDCGAQFCLGNIHQRSSFTASSGEATESRIEAYKWFHIAAAQGYLGAQTAYETLTKLMSTNDVADGDRRASAFVIHKPGASATN